MAIRTLHIVASLKRDQGGPAVSVPRLCEAVAALGAQVGLVSQKAGSSPGAYLLPETGLVRTRLTAQLHVMGRQLPYSPFFKRAVREEFTAQKAQVIHSHGLWLPCNHSAARCAKELGVPLVVHPRGMLEPWALSYRAWKKRLAWKLYQQRDLETAALFIATSRQEAESIRSVGLRQPVAVIPNGVDLPPSPSGPKQRQDVRTALFLSRIHPKKGLLNLVSAWAEVKPDGWRVVVAGPDGNGHRLEVEREVRDAGLAHVFEFAGPVAGEAKESLYRNADLFVLPTFSENFGIVVAEALSYGIPVITTRGAPWESLVTHGCGWWTEIGVGPLAEAIREATALSDGERMAMGMNGRRFVEAAFSWPEVARQTIAAYEWILGLAGKPPFVVTD
ncbi:MAG: glycosyltransferase [Syntrophobacteraceae bacterium]|nr:glycosyltransferase [Syntrophobacteraceae bacterium]